MILRSADFKSAASASFAIRAEGSTAHSMVTEFKAMPFGSLRIQKSPTVQRPHISGREFATFIRDPRRALDAAIHRRTVALLRSAEVDRLSVEPVLG